MLPPVARKPSLYRNNFLTKRMKLLWFWECYATNFIVIFHWRFIASNYWPFVIHSYRDMILSRFFFWPNLPRINKLLHEKIRDACEPFSMLCLFKRWCGPTRIKSFAKKCIGCRYAGKVCSCSIESDHHRKSIMIWGKLMFVSWLWWLITYLLIIPCYRLGIPFVLVLECFLSCNYLLC